MSWRKIGVTDYEGHFIQSFNIPSTSLWNTKMGNVPDIVKRQGGDVSSFGAGEAVVESHILRRRSAIMLQPRTAGLSSLTFLPTTRLDFCMSSRTPGWPMHGSFKRTFVVASNSMAKNKTLGRFVCAPFQWRRLQTSACRNVEGSGYQERYREYHPYTERSSKDVCSFTKL